LEATLVCGGEVEEVVCGEEEVEAVCGEEEVEAVAYVLAKHPWSRPTGR
jgi:hypothetical protein